MSRLASLSAITHSLFAFCLLFASAVTYSGTFTNATTALTAPASSTTGNYSVSFKTADFGTYNLQEKKNSGSWVNRHTFTTTATSTNNWQTTYTRNTSFTGKTSGTYSYRIKFTPGAGHPDGTAVKYSNTKVTVVTITPGIPSSITTAPDIGNDGSYTISWGTASGTVTSYKLEQQLNGGIWEEIPNVTATTHTVSGLSDGTYKYRVKACNNSGCSGYRTTSSGLVVTTPEGATTSTIYSVSKSHQISWNASVGVVDRYELYRKFNGDNWTQVYQGLDLNVTFNDLADGHYQYWVRACNTVCSDYQPTERITLNYLDLPTNLALPTGDADGAYTITWQPGGEGSATHYTLQEKINDGGWATVQDTADTSFIASGKANNQYSYQVRSCNTAGCTDYIVPQTVQVELVGQPGDITGPSILEEMDDFTLAWSTASGTVTHYELEEQAGGGNWNPVYSGADLSQPFTDHDFGTFNYRVRACNTYGCSSFTPDKTVSITFTVPPQNPPTPFDVASNLASLISQAEIDATDTVGSVGGSFRVDESGAATYSVPIATVKGTAGVVPQISLNYSSQAGNGLMGKGWSIGGLSAVTRCRQTLSQDKSAKAITWSANDRFCLDGQRLIKITGANYGAVGATYKTEIDSFAKVISVGGSNGHPDYFTVERKDGSISTYGGTGDIDAEQVARDADSNLTTKTLTWALDRFEDSVGNPIEFDYADDTNGHRISKIKYAYGSTASHGAHLEFLYETRTDGISGFLSGYKFKNNRRLKAIKSYNGTTAVRQYNLSYQSESTVNSDKISRLASLQECSGSNCLPATTFEWSKPQVGFSSTASSNVTLSTQSDRTTSKYIPADINGDGIQDIIWQEPDYDNDNRIHDQYWKYVIGSASGQFSSPVQFRSDTANLDVGAQTHPWDVIDYNLDGYMDVVLYSGGWKVFLSKPQANGTWRITSSFLSLPVSVKDAAFMDLNSDGLVDVTYRVGTNVYRRYMVVDALEPLSSDHYYKLGSQVSMGVISNPDWAPATYWWNPSSAGDVNGDGLGDAVFTYTSCFILSCGIWNSSFVSNGSGFDTGSVFSVRGSSWRDMNGDGYPDALQTDVYGVSYYAINSGALDPNDDPFSGTPPLGYYTRGSYTDNPGPYSVVHVTQGSVADPGNANQQFVDYNQDGYFDILWHDYFAKKLKVRLWNSSTESLDPAINIRTTSGNRYESHLFHDVNGDGNQDYILFRSNKLYTYLGNADGQTNDVITNITNGVGAETDITYTPLSDENHYKTLSYNEPDTIFDSYNMPSVSAFYTALNSDWSASLPAGSETLGVLSPTIEFNAPTLVVARVDSSAPKAGASPGAINTSAMSAISYYYGEARLQAAGRGFLGFERIKTVDEQTGIQTTTTYRQDWPFIGHPLKTEVRTAQNHLLSEADNTWKLKGYSGSWGTTAKNNGTSALGALKPYVAQSVEKTYALEGNGSQAGSLLQTVTTDNVYDDYGNPTSITVTTNGGNKNFQKITTNVYEALGLDLTYSKEKGRLSDTTVISKRDEDGDTSYELTSTRNSTFTYYGPGDGDLEGLLKTETIEPNDANLKLITTHSYDEFGNKVRTATTDASLKTRCDFDTVEFDISGRYVDVNYDCLGRTISRVPAGARNEYGEPLEVEAYLDTTATNSISTYYAYTSRGIRYLEGSDTGTWQATTLSDCNGGGCPTGAAYYAKVTTAGGGESREYFDVLGRSVRKANVGFDGQWIYANTEYDNLGRVKHQSEPHYEGNISHWSVMGYDILGRVTNLTLPDSSQGTTAYNGYTTVTTNDLGHQKAEIKNALGETIQVMDYLDSTPIHAYYRYDAQGNMVEMEDNDSNTTVIHYDLLGRKITMNDPDKGAWTYDYNGFGELVEQVDAKLQKSVMTYDGLGRMETRFDYTSTQLEVGNTTWVYDTAPNGLGQLNYVEDTTSGYLKAVEYDSLGRISKTVTSLGLMSVDGDHYEKVTYDQYGRTHQVFDAARNDDTYTDNGIETRYNQYGYQYQLVDAVYVNTDTRSIYQEVLAMDARGQVTSEKLGNNATTARTYNDQTGRIEGILATTMLGTAGDIQDLSYQWDTVGNLKHRKEQSGSKDLTENFGYDGLNRLTSYHVVGQTEKTIDYDLLGNITNKSDVGIYTYGANAGPHAVTNAGGTTYTYDDNGNNTSSSDGRTITYTTFDKAKTVTKGAHTTTFAYGADRTRYKRTDANAIGTKTTLYIGSVEKITNVNGTKQVKRTIGGVAIITLNQDNQGVTQSTDTNYLYKDHLGSLDIITDATGAIATNGGEMSFDAFGQRRDAINWQDISDSIVTAGFGVFTKPVTTRGFTGHEMADEVGIIHMNGRIYDPKLGRFLQADPFVQEPTNTQGLNRYSYVNNNPLNATDPSGFFFDKLIKILDIVVVVVAVVVGVATGCLQCAMGIIESWLGAKAYLNAAYAAFTALSGGMVTPTFGYDFEGGGPKIGISGGEVPDEKVQISRTQQKVLSSTGSESTGWKFDNAATTESFLHSISINSIDSNLDTGDTFDKDRKNSKKRTNALAVNLTHENMPEVTIKGERRRVYRGAINDILIYGERRAASKAGRCSATDGCIDKFEEINKKQPPGPILPEKTRKGGMKVKPGHPVKVIVEEIVIEEIKDNAIQNVCEVMNEDFCNGDEGAKPWLP